MGERSLSQLPEYRDYCRARGSGLTREEDAGLAVLRRVEQEGDRLLIARMLHDLLGTYARHGESEKAAAVLDRLYRVEPPLGLPYIPWLLLSVLGDIDLAEKAFRAEEAALQRGQAGSAGAFRMKSVGLAILIRRGRPAEELAAAVDELHGSAYSTYIYGDPLIEAASALVRAGIGGTKLVDLLERAWAEVARAVRFHGRDPEPLEEIERLLEQAHELSGRGISSNRGPAGG